MSGYNVAKGRGPDHAFIAACWQNMKAAASTERARSSLAVQVQKQDAQIAAFARTAEINGGSSIGISKLCIVQ